MSRLNIEIMDFAHISELREQKNLDDNYHKATIILKTGKRITVRMFGEDVEVDEVHIWSFYSN